MTPQDRQAIDELFAKLQTAERQAPVPDAEAQSLIQERVGRQPGAPYLMAQTIVMQDYALRDAQQRIDALQREVETARTRQAAPEPDAQQGGAGAGGFLSGLFGGSGRALTPGRDAADRQPETAGAGGFGGGAGGLAGGLSGLFNRGGQGAGVGGGGGFLAGAAQTAMGVAGGMALGHMVSGMFGGGSAKAGENGGDDRSAWGGQNDESGGQDDSQDNGGWFDSFGGDDEY